MARHAAIVTSDRWWAYTHLPLKRRQVCWAHLRRDFNAHADGLGAENEFGEHGLRVCEELFWSWEIYQHTGDRHELKRRIRALRREFKPILRTYAGKQARYRYTRGMARNLLKIWPALWTFADHQRVQPTNNHAERAPRGSVIYRKLSLGTQSADGETPDRAAALRPHHLPAAAPPAARLPRRRHRSSHPRRPRPAAGLTQPRATASRPTERLLKPTGGLEPPTPSLRAFRTSLPVTQSQHSSGISSARDDTEGVKRQREGRQTDATRAARIAELVHREGSGADTRMPSRKGRTAAAQRPDCRRPPSQGAGWVVRFDLGDGPTEAGKLAGNGDGDQGAAVVAALHPPPRAVQSLLRAPADRDCLGG